MPRRLAYWLLYLTKDCRNIIFPVGEVAASANTAYFLFGFSVERRSYWRFMRLLGWNHKYWMPQQLEWNR